MSTPRPSVANLSYDEASSGSNGLVQIDRRTPPFGLTELAAETPFPAPSPLPFGQQAFRFLHRRPPSLPLPLPPPPSPRPPPPPLPPLAAGPDGGRP